MTSLVVAGRIAIVRLSFAIARQLPIRRRAVLATSHAERIDGNLACIHAELARRVPEARVVVLAFHSRPGVTGTLSAVFNSIRAAFLLATSSAFIVDDYFFPIYIIRPRPGTTIIQVWHACGAFKKFGHSLRDKSFGADESLTGRVEIHSNYDVCLASSRAAAASYAEAFGQPLERFVWSLGVPKTDLLFGQRASRAAEAVRQRYAIPTDRRVILYAPTFRGDRAYAARHPDFLDLGLLEERLGEDHVLLLRLHPFVRSQRRAVGGRSRFVIDVSDHPEIADVMLASDLLVTDYSSVIFDFSVLARPIVLFAPDHAEYEQQRGFYFDYRREGPGPVFETTAEVGAYLRAGRFDVERVERFRSIWFEIADGRSSRRVVERLVGPALEGRRGQA